VKTGVLNLQGCKVYSDKDHIAHNNLNDDLKKHLDDLYNKN
jgi:hypothetical protein